MAALARQYFGAAKCGKQPPPRVPHRGMVAVPAPTRKDPEMRGHGTHIWMCGAMVVGALIVVLSTGNAFAFIPVMAAS